jgi:hypothetical protein
VVSVAGDEAVVKSRLLEWDGRSLVLGEPVLETATCAVGSTGFVDDLAPGDAVSLHWHWICDKLTSWQLRQLQLYTTRHLRIANGGVEHRGTALAIG